LNEYVNFHANVEMILLTYSYDLVSRSFVSVLTTVISTLSDYIFSSITLL